MISQSPRLAAGSRDDKHVGVAVVLAGERDRRPVGREDRIGFNTNAGGQSRGLAALARRDPQVAGERERDVSLAQGRFLQQQRLLLRETGARDGAKAYQDRDYIFQGSLLFKIASARSGN